MNLVGTVLPQSAGISDAQSQFCPPARRRVFAPWMYERQSRDKTLMLSYRELERENWGQYTVVRRGDTSFLLLRVFLPTGSLYFPFFMILEIFSRENMTHII